MRIIPTLLLLTLTALALTAASADESILYELAPAASQEALAAWSFSAETHAIEAATDGASVLAFSKGEARLRLSGGSGKWLRLRAVAAWTGRADAWAYPLRQDQKLERIPLTTAWTFKFPQPDPRQIELGFVVPEHADGVEISLKSSERMTIHQLQIVDIGAPPAAEAVQTELLADPGWEEVPARGAMPSENGYNKHLNGWMGWLRTSVDLHAITPVPANVRTGEKAVLISGAGGGIRQQIRPRLKLGHCYSFSVWAKGRGSFTLNRINIDSSPAFMASPDEWRQFHFPSCYDNPPFDGITFGILVNGKISFDDFSLKEIPRDQIADLRASCAQWTVSALPGKVVQSVPEGETRSSELVTLKNEHLRVVLSPLGGGHVVEIESLADGRLWRNLSLLAFGFPLQPVPIDWKLPFRAELSVDGNQVTFSHTVTGGEAAPFLDGLHIEQSFSLPSGGATLEARLRLTNTSSAPRLPMTTVENRWPREMQPFSLSAYGSKLAHGYVLQAGLGDAGLFTTSKESVMIHQPVEGWCAATHDASSLLIGFDPRTVQSEHLQPAQRQLTLRYPRLPLPPGGSWESALYLAAAPLDAVAYADRNIAVKVRLHAADNGEMELEFAAAPLRPEVRCTARIVGYDGTAVASAGPDAETIDFRPPAGAFITQLTITEGAESYEVELFNDSPERLQGAGIHGAGQIQYTPVVPARIIQLPDAGDHRATIAAGRDVLWCFGLFSHYYPLKEVLTESGYSVQILSNGDGFPEELEELLSCRLVILSNLGARHLTAAQRATLSQYVRSGGQLLVLGGSSGLGNGATRGSDLEDLLPATLHGPFEVRPLPAGGSMLRPADALQAGELPWQAQPRLYWRHLLTPRQDARVLAWASNEPILIAGDHGRGRVILFAGTVEGNPAPGETAAWEWGAWPAFWKKVIAYMYAP